MSEILDLGDHEIVPVSFLPNDHPPVVLEDFPTPGSYAMLFNDELGEGEDAAAPDHFERHGQIIGPVTVSRLLELLEEKVGRTQARSEFYEKLAAQRALSAKLEELLEGYDPEVIRMAATDCKQLMGVI